MKKFILIGAAGYIAPKHLEAIKKTGNTLIAALDKSDSVGILDSYFPSTKFFIEFERFERYVEKLKEVEKQHIDYVTICSPNYLHDAHIRFALRIGADVICEKPLVLNPWNIDILNKSAKKTGRIINSISQLRLHPSIIKIKKTIDKLHHNGIYDVDLTYITFRGPWYEISWKGDVEKSGGLATNIGVHFFDILTWIFGCKVKKNMINLSEPTRIAGYLELEKARIRWFLSINKSDLSLVKKKRFCRSLTINGEATDLSKNFTNLHIKSYENILAGKGFGPEQILPSIKIISEIRKKKAIGLKGDYHPLLKKIKND